MRGQVMQVDPDDDGSNFTNVVLTMDKPKEPTPEELAAQAAKEQQELLARCAEERRVAKEKMLARNEARIKALGNKLKPGETLEQYDDRAAKEGK